MTSIAVVTGAGRGIGRAIAIALADRGCDVALLSRKHPDDRREGESGPADSLASVADEIKKRGRRVLAISCDVSKSSEVDDAARRVLADFGAPPRIVINNAGVVHRVTTLEMTEEQWDHVIDVNLKGTFLVTRAFLGPMLAIKRGRFIAIGSISGTMGTPKLGAYCASKWGTVGFVKSLGEELRGTGLQSMCVMPGSVDTDMLVGSGFAPSMTAEEVAKIVCYAALDAPDAMNGSCIEAFG